MSFRDMIETLRANPWEAIDSLAVMLTTLVVMYLVLRGGA